jgi:predicted transcriptional regulator
MKLRNNIIISLVNLGISATTEHDVPIKDAYKAYAFRHAIEKANKDLEDKRQGLVKSAGIEDGQKFDERMKELRKKGELTEEEKKELSEMTEKLNKFNELYKELLADETELEGVKVMAYESYHALAKENRGKEGKPDIFSILQGELEGILWEAPKED